MTPEQQTDLSTLAHTLFDVSVRFKIAAKENKSRKEVLNISKDYCKTIDGIYTFLKTLEVDAINNPTIEDLNMFDDCDVFGPEYDNSDEN